jgi:hypothetical protein
MRLIYFGMSFRSWLLATTVFHTPKQLHYAAVPSGVLRKIKEEEAKKAMGDLTQQAQDLGMGY